MMDFSKTKVQFSYYPNGNIRGELFNERDVLLYRFTQEGEVQSRGRALCIKDSAIAEQIIGHLIYLNLFSIAIPKKEGDSIRYYSFPKQAVQPAYRYATV